MIISFLLKCSCIILCRFSSKRCSISSVHKPYIVLNKICIVFVSRICFSVPSYTAIIVLLPSNS
nr:MAG TPA: hypothetical protein [Bacteriophage sp.]